MSFSSFWWLICSFLFSVSFVYLFFFLYFFLFGVVWGISLAVTYVAFFYTSVSNSTYVSAEPRVGPRSAKERVWVNRGSRYKVPDPGVPEGGRVQSTLLIFLSG